MQKNDELILKTEDMGVDGAGIGKSGRHVLFLSKMLLSVMWCGRRLSS